MGRPTTELAHLFRQLKAPAAARALPKLADRARAEEWSYEQFAAVLLKTENAKGAPDPRPRFRLRRYAAPPEPREHQRVEHYWLPDPGALFGSC